MATSKAKPAVAVEAPAKKTAAKKAASKAPGTAVAVKKPTNGAVVDMKAIQDKLREQAAGMGERTQPPGGVKIQVTQDKKFKLPNGETVDELLACVVDFRTVHNFYEGIYDPKNIVPPVCFAVGTNPKMMIPVKDAPQLQAETCQICPQNQFGSAVQGEGKACKNGRRLALLPPNNDGTDVDADADMWTLDVSPTALRAWDGYVATLSRQNQLPPVAFLTSIKFNDAMTYPSLTFGDPVPIPSVAAAFARQDEAAELLEVKPDWSGYDADAAPAKGKAKPAAKAATRPVARGMARR